MSSFVFFRNVSSLRHCFVRKLYVVSQSWELKISIVECVSDEWKKIMFSFTFLWINLHIGALRIELFSVPIVEYIKITTLRKAHFSSTYINLLIFIFIIMSWLYSWLDTILDPLHQSYYVHWWWWWIAFVVWLTDERR